MTSSQGTALIAFPTMKNTPVVPAYTAFGSPSGGRYIASGGPPAWAGMVLQSAKAGTQPARHAPALQCQT